MENIKQAIKKNKLIKPGEIVGVAVSGGSDSMSLLHYLNSIAYDLDFEVVAITVDHSTREESSKDAEFVLNWCKSQGIRAYKFKVDAPKVAAENKENLEKTARDLRFGVFDSLLKKDIVDKIAIAHNMKDQAETILLHLFRGTGIAGATGMAYIRNNQYIRPMLNTSKQTILKYIFENDIPYVNDITNEDTTFSRNYIRKVVMPLIENRWPQATEKIVNFGKDCADDNEHLEKEIVEDAIIYSDKTAKIPNSYFLYSNALISRMIFKAFKQIGVEKDIDRTHTQMVKHLALKGENGKKIKLPGNVYVHKEYDYVTVTNKQKEVVELNVPFKSGSFTVPNFGTVTVKRTKNTNLASGELLIDAKKLPKDCVWRFRQNGDVFEKFGGGSKKLKDYLIDRKIPNRIRSSIPVLASGKNVYVIAGVEIADSVKVDASTQTPTKIIIS